MVRFRESELLVDQLAGIVAQEVGIQFLDHGVQTIAHGEGVARVRFPFDAGAGLDTHVFRQEEVTSRHTQRQAPAFGRFPEVRPEEGGQSRVVLGGIIGCRRNGVIDILGGAETEVEEAVRVFAAQLDEPARRDLLRQFGVHHQTVLVLFQVVERITLALKSGGVSVAVEGQPPVVGVHLVVL